MKIIEALDKGEKLRDGQESYIPISENQKIATLAVVLHVFKTITNGCCDGKIQRILSRLIDQFDDEFPQDLENSFKQSIAVGRSSFDEPPVWEKITIAPGWVALIGPDLITPHKLFQNFMDQIKEDVAAQKPATVPTSLSQGINQRLRY